MRAQRFFDVSDLEKEDILDTRDLDDCLDLLDEESEDEDERELYAALDSLQDEIGTEWKHGVALIRESYFEDYAREDADSIWGVEKMGPLANYIDWDRWAEDLKTDYSAVEIGSTTFYYRS